jgi:uncharacterized protein (DUF2141 family)
MVEIKKFKLVYFFIGLIFTSCALQLPPDGGEIDLIPPSVVSSFPPNGTVNYSENYFEITFSEYVDKRSFRESIFISPSIEGEMKIDWSGKTAEVQFPSGLRKNTTYVITIGTDVVDLNNKNRMSNAYVFTFSTGERIDDKIISGKVYDSQVDGTMIFAYRLITDTSNYLLTKPDYISQCGKDGSYSIKGLPTGLFRIFAIKDQFRDLIFQAEQDMIGIPSEDVSLSEDTLYDGLNFYLSKLDTLPPQISDTRMLDEKHVLLRFTEELNLETLNKNFFKFIDSSGHLISDANYVFTPLNKNNELILIPDKILTTQSDVIIRVEQIQDIAGNKLTGEEVSFSTTDKKDTNSIKIINTEPVDAKIDHLDPKIKIFFDDAIVKNYIDSAINFFDNNENKIPIDLSFIDDAKIRIAPKQRLKPDSKYKLVINLKLLPDASNNLVDSLVTINFFTRGDYEYSGVSGKVNMNTEKVIVFLESEYSPTIKYFQKLDSKNTFDFSRVLPGKYRLGAFEDRNENGVYDFGTLFPFQFSERFFYYPETIEVRPRWSVSDIVFEIK